MIAMKKRTPKIKEFVSPPFTMCPDCGTKDSFGVLMISNGHYTRRCTHCWFDKRVALPPLRKKRIYLDQFVVSNMMKELDPDRPEGKKGFNGGFYRKIFEKLDRLSKLQLVVCPDSPIHEDESIVDSRYEKLRSVFRHLSHGVSIDAPAEIYQRQVFDAFDAWQREAPVTHDFTVDRVLSGEADGWKDRIRIEMNFKLPGLAEVLKTGGNIRTAELRDICLRWQTDPAFSFAKVVDEEVAGFGRAAIAQFETHVLRWGAMQRGLIPADASLVFPPDGADLVGSLLGTLAVAYPDPTQRLEQVKRFFDSTQFRSIPFVRTSALFWATLARDLKSGRSQANFPRSGMFNDIEAVAAFAPYCDAMFVDKEISRLAHQPEIKKDLGGRARLFSLRHDEAEAFLDYLERIEVEAPRLHIDLVKEVYGSDWATPFWELLGVTGK